MTVSAPNDIADLGDLTFDPTLVHRLTIQLSGNAPGTGTNTPDGVQTVPGVVMTHPADAIYDFIPGNGPAGDGLGSGDRRHRKVQRMPPPARGHPRGRSRQLCRQLPRRQSQ